MPRKPRSLPGTVTVVDPVNVGEHPVCTGTAPGLTKVQTRWIDLDKFDPSNEGTYWGGADVNADGTFTETKDRAIYSTGDWILAVFDGSVSPARKIAEDTFTVQ